MMSGVTSYLALYEYEVDAGDLISALLRFINEGLFGNVARTYDCHVMYRHWPKAKKIKQLSGIQDVGDIAEVNSIEFSFGEERMGTHPPRRYGRVLVSGPASIARFLLIQVDSGEESALIDGFLSPLANEFQLTYGYIRSWSKQSDAFLDALGITSGYPSTEEEKANAALDQAWFDERVLGCGDGRLRRFRDSGMLRDIYPINILNRRHLEFRLQDADLCSEIGRNSWGVLEAISDKNWLWILNEDMVDSVRARLKSTGLLVAAR